MSLRLVIRKEEPFGTAGPFFYLAYDLKRGRVFKWTRNEQFVPVGFAEHPSPRIRVGFKWHRDQSLLARRVVPRARLIYAAAHGLNVWDRGLMAFDVHHLNGDCTDDRPENLELIDPVSHRLLEYDKYLEDLQRRIDDVPRVQMVLWEDIG
jgi:hypothetical protein